MLCVETIGKIRRRRLVHGESISAIARDLGLSRNTVKKALRLEGEEFEYRRRAATPAQARRVSGNARDVAGGRGEVAGARTAHRAAIYEALCWRATPARSIRCAGTCASSSARHPITTAFIPQSFAPGEAYQFDWSHEHVELGGADQVVKVAHVRLCHSRTFFLVAYPRESQEMVFDAHARAFASSAACPGAASTTT